MHFLNVLLWWGWILDGFSEIQSCFQTTVPLRSAIMSTYCLDWFPQRFLIESLGMNSRLWMHVCERCGELKGYNNNHCLSVYISGNKRLSFSLILSGNGWRASTHRETDRELLCCPARFARQSGCRDMHHARAHQHITTVLSHTGSVLSWTPWAPLHLNHNHAFTHWKLAWNISWHQDNHTCQTGVSVVLPELNKTHYF